MAKIELNLKAKAFSEQQQKPISRAGAYTTMTSKQLDDLLKNAAVYASPDWGQWTSPNTTYKVYY